MGKALRRRPYPQSFAAVSVSGGHRERKQSRKRCELISPSGQRVRFHMQHPVAIFSRMALNGLLLERARRAGVDVRHEHVTRIAGTGGDWQLLTPQREYRASYLMLAAGARNPFRSQFLSPIPPSDLMVTAGYFIPRHSSPGNGSLMQIQFLKGVTGYIWVFPRADHVSAGIAGKMGEVSTAELRRILEKWLRENGFHLDNASTRTFSRRFVPRLSKRSKSAAKAGR